ncbi:MAG: CotH kinase family protein [Butyrivibrio sp.]|nr:CotH kinase family protein [Butyrivibrio sp.]
MEKYLEATLGRNLADIEDELELEKTDFWYSDDVHDAGTVNYDDLEINEPEASTLPRVDIALSKNYLLSKEYSDCHISLSNCEGYSLSKEPAQIRIRGNWTAAYEKKPFKIKFISGQGLFGSSPDKSWALLANYMDGTQIHNYVAYDLYDYLTDGEKFTPIYRYVDLYINDVYIGVYALTDQISVGKDRVDINDKVGMSPAETDYLVEQDYRLGEQEPEGEDVYWFWSRYNNITYSVKSPANLGKRDLDYMRDYIDTVYVLAKLGEYEKVDSLIDIDSFIDYFMTEDIIRNPDVAKASVFMCKRAGEKMEFPCIWDCDLTFGGLGIKAEGVICQYNYLYSALMEMPEFRARYLDSFFERKDGIREHMDQKIEEAYETYGNELANEYYNWEQDNTEFMLPEMCGLEDYREEIDMMKEWLDTQLTNLEYNYAAMY